MTDSESLHESYLQSCREFWMILGLLAAFGIWNVLMGHWLAANEVADGESVKTILGMPRWIFVTVLAPWAVGNVTIVCFAIWGMKDTDLGDDSGVSPAGDSSV